MAKKIFYDDDARRKRIYDLEKTVARLRVQLTDAGIKLDPQITTELIQ